LSTGRGSGEARPRLGRAERGRRGLLDYRYLAAASQRVQRIPLTAKHLRSRRGSAPGLRPIVAGEPNPYPGLMERGLTLRLIRTAVDRSRREALPGVSGLIQRAANTQSRPGHHVRVDLRGRNLSPGMNPSRGLDAFALPIYEPILLINTYGQPLWKTLFSPYDASQGIQYGAHYLLSGPGAMQYIHRAVLLLIVAVFWAGCCGPHTTGNLPGATSKIIKAEPPPWQFFLTITPEQIRAARSAPECRSADNDPDGHWGTPWEGSELSIRLQKNVFTNGEPIVACVTLRNVGAKVLYFWVSTPQPERNTEVIVLRGQERLPPADGPKPGQSFQQRLRYVWQGSQHQEPLMPGTQRQFLRDLSEMFDLTLAGSYSAHAEREVVALDRVPDRPGYLKGSNTKLLSGTVVFQVVGARHSE
jgi:hypothetical protein